jgi:hypothetical protein
MASIHQVTRHKMTRGCRGNGVGNRPSQVGRTIARREFGRPLGQSRWPENRQRRRDPEPLAARERCLARAVPRLVCWLSVCRCAAALWSRGLDERAGPPWPNLPLFRPILHAGLMVCDKAAPSAVVMLHLRARYVSKAAILGVPGRICSGQNRSPI